MHVTHLDEQIISTRCVLGSNFRERAVAEPRPCEWSAWPPI